MVLTKGELLEYLSKKAAPLQLLDPKILTSMLVSVLKWNDDEPRDINGNDLCEFESLIATKILARFFCTAVAASGRLTSMPDSFTNEAVTMKKINMIKTTSSIGVMSIALSSSSTKLAKCCFILVTLQ